MSSSYNAVNNLNETIGSFKSRVDVKINSVNTSTANIRATTNKIYDSINKFKTDMVQNEQKQLAHENILRIDQILKEQFGDHEAIRRTVIGVVRDFDINLVRNSTIQEISEELWITSSRYWLSYALLAITAWVNDYPEVANNALAEGVRKDSIKCSLFFCLMNMRFGRNEAAKKWFCEYMRTLDPTSMNRESAVLLNAYLNGIFGTDKALENDVNTVIRGWVNELRMQQEIAEELTNSYQRFIQLLPSPVKSTYTELPQYCSAAAQVEASYVNVAKYDALIEYVQALNVELEDQTDENYKKRIDNILVDLISKYDQEEQELKNQQEYFRMVINNDGEMEAAEKQYEEYQAVQAKSFNIGYQMIRWAVYDKDEETNVHVRRFGLQNTKIWFKEAVENWAQILQQSKPLDFPLAIDTWKGISNGADQAEQVQSMKDHFNNNKFQLMYVNNYNIAALLVLIVSIGLAFVTPYSLTASALALGFLIFRVIKAGKEYPKRVNEALDRLNACMNELADFEQFYEDNRVKKDKLLSEVEYI